MERAGDVLVANYARFEAAPLLDQLVALRRLHVLRAADGLAHADPGRPGHWKVPVRELVGAGEPLNPEVIEQVRAAWGITIRDGYGQTETTAQVGNTPGQEVVLGSMGRPLPGYRVALVDPVTGQLAEEGEICLDLSARPLGLMTGYRDSAERTAEVMRDGYYHTGDVAQRSADGTLVSIGRCDSLQGRRNGEREGRAWSIVRLCPQIARDVSR